jgi:glycosyltransferase involved in cell wall biosynthesis
MTGATHGGAPAPAQQRRDSLNACPPTEIDLWVASYLFAPVWAGPAERFVRYGPKLAERGVRMTVVTAMRPEQPRREITNGISVERLGSATRQVASVDAFFGRAVLRALTARPRPDVMLFLTVGWSLLPLLSLLRIAGIKSMYVSTMARVNRRAARPFRGWILDRLKRIVYNAFDSLVCSTSALAEDLTILGLSPRKISIIPNGVSLNRFRPPQGPEEIRGLRQALGLPAEGPLVLYVGLRIDRKGVIELVEAWKRYRGRGGPGWLVMVGQELRDDAEFAEFYRRWDRCMAGILSSDHVELRGPHARIEEYFRVADLFVLLSQLEGTPNVIPEAMASGVAVLTTRFRGFSTDLGRDGRELVITEPDPEDVSKAVTRLLDDDRGRHDVAAAGRRWVEAHQDVEDTLNRYRTVLESLIAAKQGLMAKKSGWKISRSAQ